ARLLPRRRDRGEPRRLHRRARPRSARPRPCADAALGADVTVESGRLPAEGVQRMFDRIAPVYDAMNRVMTLGLDQRWRRATVRAAVHDGDHVLDACCGTGDLAVAAWKKAAAGHVVGLDFSERMLERARRKAPELEWVQGDVLALPFEDGSFDSAVVGFGVRNVEDLEAA